MKIIDSFLYGLIPHIGCFIFIFGSIIGSITISNLFRPFLLNTYFFYFLIFISLFFSIISSIFYLKKHDSLNFNGIIENKKYLFTLYGGTILTNLIIFFFIFPFLTNMMQGNNINNEKEDSFLKINVDIPCSGHAFLIINEINTLKGIKFVEYIFPKDFIIRYDSKENIENELKELEIFREFKLTINKGENFEKGIYN